MAKPVSREDKQAALARLDRFSRMADNAIGIPFTRFRIGFEPIIGLVPVLGDFAGLIMSGYVLVEAHRAGASTRVKGQMVRNMAIDFLAALFPSSAMPSTSPLRPMPAMRNCFAITSKPN